MQFEVKVLLIFVTFILGAIYIGPGSLSYQYVKLMADQDESLLKKSQRVKLDKVRGKFLEFVMPQCSGSSSEALDDFNVVVEIGPDGYVIRQWRNGDSKFATCFQKAATDHFFYWNAGKPIFVSFETIH
ncbi:MAG: hypothetical protein ACI8XC_003039 [Gammaproteobacteria bacterium]|jgi:hypothetical protein